MRTAPNTPLACLAALAFALLASCASYYDHRFAPAPVEVSLYADADAGAQARALVTLGGIRRPKDGRGALVEARLRLENIGPTPVALVSDTLSLLSADLRELGVAFVSPSPEPLDQGSAGIYDIQFELPEGRTPRDYDLQGLNLKFEVDFGSERVMTGINFERTALPSNDPRFSVGFGYFGAF